MKLRLKLLVSIILIVTVSLLAVQNGLLLVLSSENSDNERGSYGGAPFSARYVQIPPTLSLLHPQRRELHFSKISPNKKFTNKLGKKPEQNKSSFKYYPYGKYFS